MILRSGKVLQESNMASAPASGAPGSSDDSSRWEAITRMLMQEREREREERQRQEQRLEQERQRQEQRLEQERQKQEQRLEQERMEREQERLERREREEAQWQRQAELLQLLAPRLARDEGKQGNAGAPRIPSGAVVKLMEQDDIEAYLVTFERTMKTYDVEPAQWAAVLAPYLSGKAQQAYQSLPDEQCHNYPELKEAILHRYNISDMKYQQQFREARRMPGEPYQGFCVRLSDYCDRMTKDCRSMKEIREFFVLEQFINSLPGELRIWIRERAPKTADAAARLADDYKSAREYNAYSQTDGPRVGAAKGGPYYKSKEPELAAEKGKEMRPLTSARTPEPRCWSCGLLGHLSRGCTKNAYLCHAGNDAGLRQHGVIESQYASQLVLDTGCSRTMVRSDLVPQKKLIQGASVAIRCAHGDVVSYPLAQVKFEIGKYSSEVVVAVASGLPVDALLGTDFPGFQHLLEKIQVPASFDIPRANSFVVTTCSMARGTRGAGGICSTESQKSVVVPEVEAAASRPDARDIDIVDDDLFALSRVRRRLDMPSYGGQSRIEDGGAYMRNGLPYRWTGKRAGRERRWRSGYKPYRAKRLHSTWDALWSTPSSSEVTARPQYMCRHVGADASPWHDSGQRRLVREAQNREPEPEYR